MAKMCLPALAGKIVVTGAMMALYSTAQAASGGNTVKEKILPPSIAVQRASFKPLPTVTEHIGGLKIIVSLVNHPGVPDRVSCRFVVRTVNEGRERVAAYALLHTFNGAKSEMNSWMVPTGDLAPGQSAERLYSCKSAQYLVLDQTSIGGWPGRCVVNGEERSPCPLTVALEANLNFMDKAP